MNPFEQSKQQLLHSLTSQVVVADQVAEGAQTDLRVLQQSVGRQHLLVGVQFSHQSPNKNYFTMPNEIFSLGLDASEIAVYAYLRCLEEVGSVETRPFSASASTYRMTVFFARPTALPMVV